MRVVHGWMNPKCFDPIVVPPREARSIKVMLPGPEVTPTDGIPVVVIPAADYQRLVAAPLPEPPDE